MRQSSKLSNSTASSSSEAGNRRKRTTPAHLELISFYQLIFLCQGVPKIRSLVDMYVETHCCFLNYLQAGPELWKLHVRADAEAI